MDSPSSQPGWSRLEGLLDEALELPIEDDAPCSNASTPPSVRESSSCSPQTSRQATS